MVRNVLIAAVLLLTAVWVSTGSAEIREGLWEITTKAEIKGMSAQMPATTMKQCFTKNDMAPKPDKHEKGQECKTKELKISGDTVTYTTECKDRNGNTMVVSGKNTFKGDTFEGTANTTMKSKEQGAMQMISKMSGKYLGPCPK